MDNNPFIDWLLNLNPIIQWMLGIIIVLGLIYGAITFFIELVKFIIYIKKQSRKVKWYFSHKNNIDKIALEFENTINSLIDQYSLGNFNLIDRYVSIRTIKMKNELDKIEYFENRKDRLIIPISTDEIFEKSIARTAFSFSKDKLLVKERYYASKNISTAIELYFSRKIVEPLGIERSLIELYKLYDIHEYSIPDNVWIGKINDISSNILYAGIFYYELHSLVKIYFPNTVTSFNSDEITKIATFVYQHATETKGIFHDLDFYGDSIKISIIKLGEERKRRTFGLSPYEKAISICLSKNVDRIYLIGGGFINSNAARSLTSFHKLIGDIDVIFEKEIGNRYVSCLVPKTRKLSSFYKEKEQVVLEALTSICPDFANGKITLNGVYWDEDESKVYISVIAIDKRKNPVGSIIGRNAEYLYKLQDKLGNMHLKIVKFNSDNVKESIIESFIAHEYNKEIQGIVNITN
ncbi:MAG TPA: hypothetical protein VGB37_18050, partial [Candidatus Lokiarchaeia archaeon]